VAASDERRDAQGPGKARHLILVRPARLPQDDNVEPAQQAG
jgi:hypothetical protein